jgi:hypothetical protein
MKARQLIEGAVAFGPDQLKIIKKAFDEAWSRIENGFGHRKAEVEYVRIELAKAVLSVAGEGVDTAEAMAEAALKRVDLIPKV